MNEQAAALAMIKAVYEDGEAEINGRKYAFLKMTHKRRRKVFAFFTRVAGDIKSGNMWFLESPEFEAVEKIIGESVTFDGSLLDKLPEHWETYPDDYVTFISTALGVISYPFLRGAITG